MLISELLTVIIRRVGIGLSTNNVNVSGGEVIGLNDEVRFGSCLPMGEKIKISEFGWNAKGTREGF